MPRSSKKRRATKELMMLKKKLRKLENYLGSDLSTSESDSESTGGILPLDTVASVPEAADSNEPSVTAPSTSAEPASTRIFAVLGDNPALANTTGTDIHEELSVRWSTYLTKGIPQECRKLLLEKYPIPGNCNGLQAPRMNDEVKSILSSQVNKNDYFLSSLQNQLGAGLTAIARILDEKLRDPEATVVLADDLLLSLADAAQLFASVHQALSLKRRFEVSHLLNEDCRAATAQSPIDSLLFGSAFTEKLKSHQDMKKAASPAFKLQAPSLERDRRRTRKGGEKTAEPNTPQATTEETGVSSIRLQSPLLPPQLLKVNRNIAGRLQHFKSQQVGFASPTLPYGWLHTKPFEIIKQCCLKAERMKFDNLMDIPPSLGAEFHWWINCIDHSGKSIAINREFELNLFSDASTSGWGRMGSTRHSHLQNLTQKLWHWCEERNIFIHATYVITKDNTKADKLSRCKSISTEFELSPDIFNYITDQLGKPSIDLFASRINTKCAKYVSWGPDPDSWAVDALTLNWRDFKFYAFPPFILLDRVLEKIRDEKTTGIVVAPYWPSAPWFPLYHNLLTTDPIIISPRADMLLSPFRQHPLDNSLSLIAGILWWNYCQEQGVDPFSINLQSTLKFLLQMIQEKLSYSTLNTYRSAISFLCPFNAKEEKTLNRFQKGYYNINPTSPKYSTTWDPQVVLQFLETLYPLQEITHKQLTEKLSTLLALTSAHRVQTLSLITMNNILRSQERIEIRISSRIKTSGPNRAQPVLIFPIFKENPKLCVASTLDFYINKTESFRTRPTDPLFFTYASLTTLHPLNLLAGGLRTSYIKVELIYLNLLVTAFDMRPLRLHIVPGINIESIRSTAGWSEKSAVFSKFYNRPLVHNPDSFARAIIQCTRVEP
ncbi:hypothetical protein NQ317_004198 [Molorchus minor]|uniref:Uncharacterized protein n=1 Tax=Molorchus minor TaxID=1323400 RepID=A0ABQ9IQE1_9CUCU|nr:hypothetical protein NQ317_004198 [Molorchus minor]